LARSRGFLVCALGGRKEGKKEPRSRARSPATTDRLGLSDHPVIGSLRFGDHSPSRGKKKGGLRGRVEI
jgi:hypothetical protein